jgi:hypothetical protein
VKDNESKPAIPKKLNSHKTNLNRCRKRPRLKSAAGTLIENSDNEPIIRRGQLIKGKYNPSTQEPILASDSSIGEITTDNSKSPQPIIKPEGIH